MENRSALKPEPTSQELLRTIFGYINKIANERDVDKLLIMLADMGRDLVSADRCTVWLVDKKAGKLWSKVAHGVDRIVIPISKGIAGDVAAKGEALIINDAYNDERFDKQVDRDTGYHTRNILALPIRDSEGEIIGVYQALNKVTDRLAFSDTDLEHLQLAASYTGRQLESVLLQEEIEKTQREIIFTLAETGEMRSKETGNHVKRVAEYCRVLGHGIGLSEDETELLKNASPMHDIGKIAIPDAILLKEGPLTDDEREVIKTHTSLGYDMLCHSERRLLKAAAVVAQQHHERWDGDGYPNGTAGEDIHIYGRITAIADVFDALGSDRVYKKAWPEEKIDALFREERGRQFDPQLVDVFFREKEQLMQVREEYRDEV
jgi:HD-GYP domain-containing protein (c-di-GMP phosphodiesterase class II)